ASQVLAKLGVLNPGSSALVDLVATPTTAGSLTQSASVTASEYNLDPNLGSARITIDVLESPGTIQFGAGQYTVDERAGFALLSVVRVDGALGSVAVDYRTLAVNATAGRDFLPASGTLIFAPGQTTATIPVSILANPFDNHDEYVNVMLDSPTGGALLGSLNR